MEVVQQLRPIGTRYDIVKAGRVIRLVLEPCPKCPVNAKFMIERKYSETIPPMFRSFMMPPGKEDHTVQLCLASWHWHPTWWQRLTRQGYEKHLMRWIEESHRKYIAELEGFERVEALKETLK